MARYSDFTRRASEPMIGALLRRPVGALRARILAGLEARGFGDLHAAHLGVFQHPGPRGLRPTQLAEAAGMTKQAMNHLLGQLEQLGYLERRAESEGSRAVLVWTTERGDAAVKAIRATIAAVEAEWAAELGPTRFRQLKALLVDLNAAIDGTR